MVLESVAKLMYYTGICVENVEVIPSPSHLYVKIQYNNTHTYNPKGVFRLKKEARLLAYSHKKSRHEGSSLKCEVNFCLCKFKTFVLMLCFYDSN